MTDVIYSGTREIKTFVDLNHGAKVLIQKTEQEPEGSYFTSMSALLLTAFTFEAYLNHLGKEKIKFWDEVESIRVKDKHMALCKELDLEPDYSKRPYQTLKMLFKFRNAIAHGKSQIVKVTKEVSSSDDPYEHTPKADWEEYNTLANAKCANQDIEEIITILHKKAGMGKHPFLSGVGVGSMSLKKFSN
ncbi:MAG: hypothetical protein P8O76_03615 [Methylophilaceae bacterium]|nr:hypothetical protein [Methylophilaceae bacterium]MDG1820866.1 hypothetical protein [Methylophilaceae bacterium]